MSVRTLYTTLFAASTVVVGLLSSTSAFALNLTGIWDGDDGGTYYVRQIGTTVWWYGENDPEGPTFSNVAHGALNAAGNRIRLQWADVPKGLALSRGQLVINVVSDTQLTAIRKTGGFAGTNWAKESEAALKRHNLLSRQKHG